MEPANLAAVLDSFRSGGRCETALLDRFGSALACSQPIHAAFWAAQDKSASSPEHLLRFQRETVAWLDAFPVLVTASFRLHGAQGALVRRLAEALVATQEAHYVGVALRCLEVALRALPEEELDTYWTRLMQALFGLKAALQSDVNLPHAIDQLLALFAERKKLQGAELLAFLGAADDVQLLCEEPVFSVLRETLKLNLLHGRSLLLPAAPLPDLAELSCAQIAKLACITLLQHRDEAVQELLIFAESCWTLREVWQLVADLALFCDYSGLVPGEGLLAFALRLAKDCLQSPAALRSHRARLEALLKTAGGKANGEAFQLLLTELSAKFREALEERLPSLIDFARLLRWLPVPADLATEMLRVLLEAWSSATALQSDADLSCLCDGVLSLVKGAVTSSEGWHLVARFLLHLVPDIEAAVRSPQRAYACHFLMFLWRDAATALSQQEVQDEAAVAEVVEAGLTGQLCYGEAFCELDHFPCPCFALLQGSAALQQRLPTAGAPAELCLRLCRLFERRSVDAAFLNAVLLVAVKSPAPEALWAAAAEFCASADLVQLQDNTLKFLTAHFLELPASEDAAKHPLSSVLRSVSRPEGALTPEKLAAVERKMGRAWGDGPVPGGGALCKECGENLADLCSDVEMALRCPLNLDCIGD